MRGVARRKTWRACGCVWGVDLYVNGRKVWHNLGSDEQQARVAELRLRADIAEGRQPSRARGAGVRDQARDWLAVKEAGGARVQSMLAWRGRVNHLTNYFGDTPVTDLDAAEVRRFVEDLSRAGLAGATVNGVLAALGAIVNHARTRNNVPVQALDMHGLRLTVHERTDHLSIAECRLVIAEAPQPWSGMMEVALLTGLRKGEILALTAADVERDRAVLHVRGTMTHTGVVNDPKTRASRRAVTLSARAAEIIHDRVAVTDGRLWPYRLGEADKALRAVLTGLGLHRKGRGWHSFRNAHATLLNESGFALRDATARMGHGAHMAQQMAYGWANEHMDAGLIDAALIRHDPAPEPPSGSHTPPGPVRVMVPRRPAKRRDSSA